MHDGAMWLCVAETSIRSDGIPVSRLAITFAASINSRGIMHVSTTQIASRVLPSSRTTARAQSESSAFVAVLSVKPPFTTMGKVAGVMSTVAAPARKTFSSAPLVDAVASARVKQRIS